MQGNWKHKVQQQEATPPEGVWDAVALALDEAAKNPAWQTRVYHATEKPPPGTWERIILALEQAPHIDTILWQERIYQYETTPPAATWPAIAASLDRAAWATSIYQHEVLPPHDVWQAIAAQIETETPVISIEQKKVRKIDFARLAIAAVTVLAVAGTAIWVLQNKSAKDNLQDAVASNIGLPSNVRSGGTTTTNGATAIDTNVPSSAQFAATALTPVITTKVASAKTTASLEEQPQVIEPLEYVATNEMAYVPVEPVLQNTNKLFNDKGQTIIDINGFETPNNSYISISGPDGQSIRVSAKFANLIGYLQDGDGMEERLDRIIKESAYWKATFKQWREKMTEIVAMPSFHNFMDVVELAKLLQ